MIRHFSLEGPKGSNSPFLMGDYMCISLSKLLPYVRKIILFYECCKPLNWCKMQEKEKFRSLSLLPALKGESWGMFC